MIVFFFTFIFKIIQIKPKIKNEQISDDKFFYIFICINQFSYKSGTFVIKVKIMYIETQKI